MNKNKEYAKNTFILFLGKFSTQFMTLLLLPLYTRYLLVDDFGAVDLIQTYISLFVPVLILRLDSSVFRFLIDSRKNKENCKKIITNTFFILFVCLIITIVSLVLLKRVINIKYFNYVTLNIIILMGSNILLQILRGLGKNTNYSIACFLTGIGMLLFNIIFIVVLKYDARSILLSSILSNLICFIYVFISCNLIKYIKIDLINKVQVIEMLKYSIPMIPNSISWWIVNVSDRSIITHFLGASFNGIYSVSCKFSNLLNSIFSVFNMSWQETASLHINDSDKDAFFTNMINKLLLLFACISILIIGILPFLFNVIIGEGYIESYKYIPLLLYSNIWNILVSLIGGIYVAKKKTKEIANTTIISAIINIILNFLLINKIGLYAACISTIVAYVIIGIYRYIDCKRYVNFNLDIPSLLIFTILFIITSLIYISNNIKLNIFNLFIILVYVYIILGKDIIAIIKKTVKRYIRK